MKARLAIALSFFLLPALLLFVNNSSRANANPRPHAAHGCSAKTTVGTYFVICNGFLSPGPNAQLLPAKLLGTLNADDNGTFTGASTVMIGGGTPADADCRWYRESKLRLHRHHHLRSKA
jgi:hypothetical protein